MLLEIVLGGVCSVAAAVAPQPSDSARHLEGQASHLREAGRGEDPNNKASTPTANDRARASEEEYRIGPEDVLQINVFKEPDFSASVLVRTDGKISIPLLNDVQAVGLTPEDLSTIIQGQLGKFLKEPKVTVVVTQMNSRRAYVMGMVNRQGMVHLLANSTILQALSAAGGLAPFAKSKQIYILRSEGQVQRKIPFNYDAVIKGKHPEQNILLEPGDTVVVP